MVQEFHVLRCFACETFQVQQVKKAKKWNCKMCGEKQSVIKEYGRGTGVDCRQHVQKLNSLRGELLEEENEHAWASWEEDEECEYNREDEGLPSEPHQGDGGSRWSKYVETAATVDGDEEEEVNIYTESKRFGRQSNVRKRKKGRVARRGFGCRGDDEDDDDQDQGEGTCPWKCDKSHIKPPARSRPVHSSAAWDDHGFSISSLHSNTPTPSAASKPLPSGVPSRNVPGNSHVTSLSTEPNASRPTGPVATQRPLANTSVNREADSFAPRPVTKVSQPENKSSKWARFLSSPSNEDQGENGDGDPHWSGTDESSEKPWSVGYQDSDSATGCKDHDNFKTKLEKTSRASGQFGAVPGLANRCGVADKIKSAAACFGFVSATNQMASPTFTTSPIDQEMPVCYQPPPAKRPCPGLALSSLFQTDEDFDDTF
ncbi:hypothetical protein AALO_G00270190 [Alosa alosa]|uniref:MRN complex-interacting protein N-terminal domain-containing protein n=1 Tax=Alosa alosa TaxID=278164 RepID=A0AAV6FQF2_9TELE|nr:MRN complex-interacting protein [Alosa alosa]KAG5263927.1 hypothetical protein AALO_G00270190 [Alosa alosa]